MKIGFDLMGSDSAPKNELEALRLLKEETICDLLVCGTGDYEKEVVKFGFEFRVADEVIGMHEIPSVAIRKKKNSSLGILVQLLQKKEIEAIVSAGNTGAILGFSMVSLGKIEGLSRAGLAITLPVENGYSIMLDVGSNINPKAIDYYNYGLMGSVLSEIALDKENPRVALLNIGSEQIKGDEVRQRAYQMLQDRKMNFIGNIEGNNIMKGFADVIVTDGFTGNVILKFLEGMIDSIWSMLREEVDAVARRKVGQFLVKPAVEELKGKFNYEEYGGGILLGVEGVVIVCHGHSSSHALKNAIKLAKTCIEFNIIEEIKKRIKK
ncbi:MAG TPA: phosphate acyltransferase PlsX [candidate division WOR-3 bacterium]|uniref:Phosphate acyltransferase n=1 Tax=candidate division WOR-3 bacterium TaxID=2052148 RepID=A0A9C9JZX1_UNCW3|nr:phosphate acyltransferase PlsX [candidate division WOR-3 bacterium]